MIIDGSEGLQAGVEEVFGPETPVQRCQYHKRENVIAYLPKSQQAVWRGKLARAYAQPTYAEAKAAFEELRADLRRLNESALRSLDEGPEEALTVHRLGVGPTLRQTLATTNMLESVFSGVEMRTGKVDRWRTSNQKHRWLAAALLPECRRARRARGRAYRADRSCGPPSGRRHPVSFEQQAGAVRHVPLATSCTRCSRPSVRPAMACGKYATADAMCPCVGENPGIPCASTKRSIAERSISPACAASAAIIW